MYVLEGKAEISVSTYQLFDQFENDEICFSTLGTGDAHPAWLRGEAKREATGKAGRK